MNYVPAKRKARKPKGLGKRELCVHGRKYFK